MSTFYCPACGAPEISRERRPNGNSTCTSGHTYQSRMAVVKKKVPTTITTKVVTKRTTLELTDKEVELALLEHFGMAGGEVEFDISHGEFLKGATLTMVEIQNDS